MSFNDDFLRAEAIREVRASGCTLPGVAELIVEHHGASAILANTSRIQALGEEVAASDTETGAKMRRLLLQMSTNTGTAATDVLKEAMTKKDETKSSTPSESKAAVAASAGATTGSASDAAAGADASGEAAAAAGNSAAESESAA